MRIYRATLSDLESIVPLYHAYRAFYGLAIDDHGVRRFLTEHLEKQDTYLFVAATQEGELMGFAQLFQSYSIYNLGNYFVLNDLYVASEHRRAGVGRTLLHHVQEFARAQRARGILLETGHDNHAAQALYRSMDFKEMDSLFMGWEG